MKKKLTIYILISIIFILIVVTSLLSIIFNHQYEQSAKKNLKNNNEFINNLIKDADYNYKGVFKNKNFKNLSIRVTFIDKSGTVLFDSDLENKKLDNHNNRQEIIEAREYGEGYNIRFSESSNKNMIYYALKIYDDYIIRSSLSINSINLFQGIYLKYYLFSIFIIVVISIWFSSKLAYIIVKPIKDLDTTTSFIANGNLHKRVIVSTKDEIGKLAENFNYMTERLQNSMNEVIDKQNRLRAILTSMDSGVIAIDRDNNVIMINPYAEKIFGIEKNIVGDNLFNNISNLQLENIFNDETDQYHEIKISSPQERELRIKTKGIINRNEYIGIVAVVQDITDLKRLEHMRTQFVANVSHELKTPLTSIKGFAETLKYVDDVETREKFLNIINDETERLTRLINDILILSRIEKQSELFNDEVHVNKILLDVYNLLKNTAEKKNVLLSLKYNNVRNLVGDEDKFKQMIINLVDNGIKYTEPGDSVTIEVKDDRRQCIIIVKDTGVGISQEHIPRLFERFYRVDKARSRAKGGTGLGLAIVKHVVILFEGTIEVESKLGEGSKFTIKIPYEEL
jgi:two-component system, OmpR family, phosphate regulon sensor histidine kinase PhoR